MKQSQRVIAVGLAWLIAVVGAALAVAHGNGHEQSAITDRFAGRAATGAASVAAYVADVFDREKRMAASLPHGPVDDAQLTRARETAGFSTSLLLDRRGRALASSPPGPTLHGLRRARHDPYLAAALTGQQAVSGVLSSAVGPIVEFTVPVNHGPYRALSSGFVLDESPLATFVSVPSIPGSHGYVVDQDGAPVVVAGEGATSEVDGLTELEKKTVDGLTEHDDLVVVAAPIEGTPWRLVITAPRELVVAPATSNDWVEWTVLVLAALALLAALAVVRSISMSRQRSWQAQAASERTFRLTIDNAPIGMLLVSTDGRVLRANARFCTMLGYESAELLTMSLRDITHEDDRAMDNELLQQLLSGEFAHYEREKRYIRSDGEPVWVRLSVSLVCDSGGAPLHFVGQSEDITELRAAQAQLEERAMYDSLTGLANRGLLIDRLTLALADHRRGGGMLAVAFCDLDHFKRVNDSLGHHAGDLVLQEVARRLRGVVRDTDTVARIGGDEFVLLLPRVGSMELATSILDRAKLAIEEPIEVGDYPVTMSISAGLSIGAPDTSAEMLLGQADRALYASKESGRARWSVYTSAMRSNALLQLSVEQELRQAIAEDEFELHYQPIVALDSRRTVAFEALLRWRHPQRGLLLPASFLDVVEDSHLTVEIGQIVLRHACRFLARHPQATWRTFVNVSPLHLGRGLGMAVQEELAAAGVAASRLGLEITENGVLNAAGSSLAEMHALRELGVELLMDDFGTGYSALSSVLTTPITGIKLDLSFTARLGKDEAADRISAAVAGLVESLGAHGVVEGIENDDQCARALGHGWKYGQGYLFARPVAEASLVLPDDGAAFEPARGEQAAHSSAGDSGSA